MEEGKAVPAESYPLIAAACRRPVGVTMVVSALVVFGAVSFTKLNYQLLPDLSYPRLTVRTVYPGAAPEDVEERITRPLEESLSVLKGLRHISSTSRAEVSEIRLEFSWGSDISSVIAEAREKIDQTILPRDAERPTILRYDPRLEPVLVFALSGPYSLEELRWIAEEEVEKALETIEGTAAVKVRGGLREEILVALDEKKLIGYGLSPDTVLKRLVQSNVNQPAGVIRRGDRSFLVRVLNEFQNVKDIQEVVLDPARDLRVRHVAAVRRSHRDPEVISRLDGSLCVRIEIYREASVNPVVLAGRVKSFVYGTAERPGLQSRLPKGVKVRIIRDQSRFIEGAIKDVTRSLVQGALLAGLVLFLFLRDLRSTILVAAAIPISIVITFTPLFLSGVSLNIMTLGGLALAAGMLVDNAIVASESIARVRALGLSRKEAAVRGTGEIAGAVAASTLTTIAVFFPIVFVSGVAAQLFRDQALSVIWALLASLGVALTFLPTLIASGGERSQGATSFPWPKNPFSGFSPGEGFSMWPPTGIFKFFLGVLKFLLELVAYALCSVTFLLLLPFRLVTRRLSSSSDSEGTFFLIEPYSRALSSCLKRPLIVVLITAVAGFLAWKASSRIGSELIPELAQGEFTLHLELPVGTPIETTDRVLSRLAEKIRARPEVELVSSAAGVDPEDIQRTGEGPHTGRLDIKLKRTSRGFATAEKQVRRLIRKLVNDPLIASYKISRPVLFTWESGLEVIVRKKDFGRLRREAYRIEEILRTVPALGEITNSMRPGQPELHILFDRVLLAKYGIGVAEAASVLKRKIQGEVGTTFPEPGRNIDIRVRLKEGRELEISKLGELAIGYWAGRPIRLREVASISPGYGPAEIERRDGQRCAVISASVEGLDLGHAVEDVDSALKAKGITDFTIGGQSRRMAESSSALKRALALAVFLVYVVMASQFESLVAPLIIMASVPLAFVGVSFLLAFSGIRLSIVVFIGLVMLAGIVVNNAIVMIDFIGRLRRRGFELERAIVEGAAARLRPILMTTLTTVLGLIPFTGALSSLPHGPALDILLGTGESGELRGPLAWTVIVGLLSSTLLTLFVIPTVYYAVEKARLFAKRRPEP